MESYEKSAQLYKKTRDTARLAEVYQLLSIIERERGHYEKSLHYALKGEEFIDVKDYYNLETLYTNLGALYEAVGDYETAVDYYKKTPRKVMTGNGDIWA